MLLNSMDRAALDAAVRNGGSIDENEIGRPTRTKLIRAGLLFRRKGWRYQQSSDLHISRAGRDAIASENETEPNNEI